MKLAYKNGVTSVVMRVKILDATSTSGAGKTGLTFSSTGLIVSTIADNEAAATAYTAAGSTIETVSTLGTYAAPTATKCRFKEVDSTNHPGLYEIQIADARWAVSNARSVIVTVSGVTGAVQTDAEIQLDPVPSDLLKINSNAGGAARFDRSTRSITTATVGSGSTTSSIVTSACDPAGASLDQFKGLIVKFDKDTTTAALRGQGTDITGSTNSATPTLTVSPLSTAPVSGDTFTIE